MYPPPLERLNFYHKGKFMEFNFNEIALLQNAEGLKQKIDEVIGILRDKGFNAEIKKSSLWDILYINDTLRFNLFVEIPVHDK